ncbi:MAG: hypothetical protein ACJAXA_000841 [Candidatus Aldehydirespiratoraceae bacterium]|jgi:hypothetical protein
MIAVRSGTDLISGCALEDESSTRGCDEHLGLNIVIGHAPPGYHADSPVTAKLVFRPVQRAPTDPTNRWSSRGPSASAHCRPQHRGEPFDGHL